MISFFRTGVIVVLIAICSAQLAAQQDIFRDDGEGFLEFSDSVLLTKETSGGIILHSQGFGIEFQKGKNVNYVKKRLLDFSLVDVRSPKEIRVINPYFTNAKSYAYGKLNSVFILRGGYGFQRLIATKPYWGGVELRYFYIGGASIGMAKPVYLNIINLVSISSYYYEYRLTTEKYDPDEHFTDNIYGRASFMKGFNEMKFYPGLYVKAGFSFDFGTYNTTIKNLELGAMIDVFPNPIPVMAYNGKEYYFLTLFLSVSFGKRYN
ncbi:MAG TPA: hypothetical protein PKH94_04935 [Bacteroidales bacterium]|nr:hypothetical protein [Bacteroidales bacterium]HNS46562.1 hypothetical protein [Bacteroidales bacterium]